ncbi:MAG: hypothetical protein ACLUKN_16940 [Bacilli bacterium]
MQKRDTFIHEAEGRLSHIRQANHFCGQLVSGARNFKAKWNGSKRALAFQPEYLKSPDFSEADLK